jgi:hypothetical protein
MKRTVLFLVISGTAALIITGCSKKNDSVAVSVKSLAGTYKLTAYTASSSGITIDMMPNVEDCEKDNLLTLKADSTYSYKDAGTVCSIDASTDGQWTISGNYFISDGLTPTDSATVKSYSGSSLVLTTTMTDQGTTAVLTQTLTKQ